MEPCLITQLPLIPPSLDLPTTSSTGDKQSDKNRDTHIQHNTALAQIHNSIRASRPFVPPLMRRVIPTKSS
ncbi:hypothetical protein SAMN05428951_10734 [Pseudomonas sp. OV546]|nr:hypothetical protein SAMN05428951_10734 [Pseudomonas sp. OV546]